MEADWSVELAAEDPVIVVPWQEDEIGNELRRGPARVARFIDLRENPQSAGEIPEAQGRPALRLALQRINAAGTMLWTAKCGVWEDGRNGGLDPIEMDAGAEDAIFSAGCYIDVLLCDEKARASFKVHERWIRSLSEKLRGHDLRCSRSDLVLRHAVVCGDSGFGVTWFVRGCGAIPEISRQRWAEALLAGLPVLMDRSAL